MKEFFSKNRFLVISTAITLVIALGLLFFIYQTDLQRNVAIQDLENLKVKIQKLNYYRPSPTEENIELINEDLKHVAIETALLEEYFGQVYNNALNAFIKTLTSEEEKPTASKTEETKSTSPQKVKETSQKNITSERITINYELKLKFLDSWKKFIEEQKKSDEALEAAEVLNNFRKHEKYPEDIFNNAKKAFIDEFKKNTFERINDINIDDYILAALGFPLDFTRISCKKFVEDIKKAIEKELRNNKILSKTENLVLFDEFTTIPNDDQIPYIIKYCRLYEDLFKRLADSKVETLTSYKKLNGLRGTKKDNYLIYQYEIQFVASLNSARNFLNSLQSAYLDNRIYIIKNISLRNISSDIGKLQRDDSKTISRDLSNNLRKTIRDNKTVSKKEENTVDTKQVVILLGASDLIKINIVFDYIIYDEPITNM